MKRTISLLGSTGSIGRQTLEVARQLGLPVAALAAKNSVDLLEQQAREFLPELVVLYEMDAAMELAQRLSGLPIRVAYGMEGLLEAASMDEADTVVIAAPYWDLTFPAVLRLYLEQVSVAGIAFRYTYLGRPIGLCRARRLYYVTTAGGPIGARNLGFQYVQELAGSFFGIPRLACFSAEKLDMLDADVPAILQQAVAEMEKALPPAAKRPQAP